MRPYARMTLCGMICAFLMAGCPGSEPGDRTDAPMQTKILFQSDCNGNSELYLMDLDGSDPVDLTAGPGTAWDGVITSDGRQVIFYFCTAPGACDLVRMNIDGTNRKVLVSGAYPDLRPPVLTAGDSRVVFRMATNSQAQPDIVSLKLDGTGLVDLTPSGWAASGPILHPGTSRIGFCCNITGNYEIYEVDAAGGMPVNLTQNAADDYGPIYSLDGSKIAFTSDRDGPGDLYIMNADGTNPIRLTNESGVLAGIAFSPDGSQILYQGPVPGADNSPADPGNYDEVTTDVSMLNVANVDGTGHTELAITNDFMSEQSWSPDGQIITFMHRDGTSRDIFTVKVDGTGLTNLTNSGVEVYDPVWTPDGQRILFERWCGEGLQIYSMNPDGTDQKNLSDSSGSDSFRQFVNVR